MREIPDVILKAEAKAMSPEEKVPESVMYKGNALEQIRMFETTGKEILATMIVSYGIKPASMKELFAEDNYVTQLQEVKLVAKQHQDTNIQATLEKLDHLIATTLDQYEGLRQIADFRGIPEYGEVLVREGNAVNNLFRKMMLAAQTIIIKDLIDGKNFGSHPESKFEEASKKTIKTILPFKNWNSSRNSTCVIFEGKRRKV